MACHIDVVMFWVEAMVWIKEGTELQRMGQHCLSVMISAGKQSISSEHSIKASLHISDGTLVCHSQANLLVIHVSDRWNK